MKNILFVVDERKMGGTSIVLESIFNNIPDLKADVLVLHNSGDRLENIKNLNVIYGTKFFNVCDEPLKEVIKSKKIFRIFKKMVFILLIKTGLIKYFIKKERRKILNKSYDIEVSFKDGFGTFFVAYGDSCKKIRWIHNDYLQNSPGKNYAKLYRKALDSFDVFVAISKTIKDHFINMYGHENKTIVINNIVAKPRIDRRTSKNSKFNIAVVGRLSAVKRYDMLVEIINRLNNNGIFKNSVLNIVGDGPERSKIEALIDKYNLNNYVKLFGQKNNPWTYVQNADLFVMCSKYEAYPLTVIESQLMKIPVISVNFSAAKEMIEIDQGLIVNNDFDSLYNGLKLLISDKSKILSYKKSLANYNYDNEKIIIKIKDILEILGAKDGTK